MERVVRNGFEDNSLYNDELLKLGDVELQEFDDLKKIIGQTKAMPKTNQVDINNQGLDNEEYEEKEKLEKKPKKELTEEERKRLEELKKKYPDTAGTLHLENFDSSSASIRFTPQTAEQTADVQ